MFTFLKRFCTIAGVGTVLVSSVTIGLVPREAKAVDVGTIVVITCPDVVQGRINWPNKIGSDPAFSPVMDNMVIDASDGSISRPDKQTIICTYRLSRIQTTPVSTPVSGGTIRYSYTAKRNLYECKNTSIRQLTCRVKD